MSLPNFRKVRSSGYGIKLSEALKPRNDEHSYLTLHAALTLADLGRGGGGGLPGMRAHLGVQILSFSCSFQQIIRKIIDF